MKKWSGIIVLGQNKIVSKQTSSKHYYVWSIFWESRVRNIIMQIKFYLNIISSQTVAFLKYKFAQSSMGTRPLPSCYMRHRPLHARQTLSLCAGPLRASIRCWAATACTGLSAIGWQPAKRATPIIAAWGDGRAGRGTEREQPVPDRVQGKPRGPSGRRVPWAEQIISASDQNPNFTDMGKSFYTHADWIIRIRLYEDAA